MTTLYNTTANTLKFLTEETGYFHIQATKPDTVGEFKALSLSCLTNETKKVFFRLLLSHLLAMFLYF